jgi:hypothetical protein
MRYAITAILLIGSLFLTNAEGWENPADRYADAYKKYLGAGVPIPQDTISHFVYFARDRESMRTSAFLSNPRFTGAQIMYPWSSLEPERDKYDFTMILEDYQFLAKYGKKLFVQLQDATFRPEFNAVPLYLLSKEFDGGAIQQKDDRGVVEGWVAKRWNEKVRERFALLLKALGKEFDGKIAGINLQETAIGVSTKDDLNLTGKSYVQAIKANMLSMRKSFSKSITMQYANFMIDEWLPWDDKGFLREIYQYGEEIGVGLGGPDLLYTKKGQQNHMIAMMHEGKFTVPLGVAVQDGNYIGETGSDKVLMKRTNIVPVLHAFAKDFLHIKYMFWSYQEPYFTEDVLPAFSIER